VTSILWQRVNGIGLDRATLAPDPEGFRIAGTALMAEGGDSYDIRYSVQTDLRWRTRVVAAFVQGPEGERRLSLRSDEAGRWTMGDQRLDDLAAAIDVDFAFTPATNTLPIKRLDLQPGESADVTVAHIAFPGRSISLRAQTYERIGDHTYRYTSGDFTVDLTVDDGLITDYPGFWQAV
jgi:hypothetical protein